MNENKIDLTQPFIAIRNDLEGSDYDATMGEYLCNPLDEDLLDVEVSTGGFFGADELGVIEAKSAPEPVFIVPAGTAVRFALSTWDEYCEYVLHWTVRYRTETKPEGVRRFETFKYLRDCVPMKDVPCLGGPGQVVPF